MTTSISGTVNRQCRLAARPVGMADPGCWTYTDEPLREPNDGEMLVRVRYISLDPAMRGWMNDSRSYVPPVGIGEVMRAGAVGEVIASRHPGFAAGEHVLGIFGVQEYAYSDGSGVTKVDPAVAPLPVYLGALGMPGLTAYFGLLEVGQAKAGDTVVVSGAAGAVSPPKTRGRNGADPFCGSSPPASTALPDRCRSRARPLDRRKDGSSAP